MRRIIYKIFLFVTLLSILTGCNEETQEAVFIDSEQKDIEDQNEEIGNKENDNEDSVASDDENMQVTAVLDDGKTSLYFLAEKTSDINKNLEIAETVEEKLSGMSIHEKVCQMIFVNPENLVNVRAVTSVNSELKAALVDYPVGGIMLKGKNIISGEQVKSLITGAQSYSEIELFIAVDEEGGIVNRLMNNIGTTYVDSMYTYKDMGCETAFKNAEIIGNDLAEYGFNLDFAPVADVWSNPNNTVIGERAYSDSFLQAAELIPYAVQGFHSAGIMCTLKHFPGHGNTNEDSHYGSSYVNVTLEELRENEFLPFEAGIEAGAEFVMMGHLIVSDIDDVPATLSKKIVTDILREELSFDGVVITDSFQMSAITNNYENGEAAVMAIKAGIDMILEPENLQEVVTAIETAVYSGEITEDRLDESVRRILITKLQNNLDIL